MDYQILYEGVQKVSFGEGGIHFAIINVLVLISHHMVTRPHIVSIKSRMSHYKWGENQLAYLL